MRQTILQPLCLRGGPAAEGLLQGDEEAVRSQNAADLSEDALQIDDMAKCRKAKDTIERCGTKRQRFRLRQRTCQQLIAALPPPKRVAESNAGIVENIAGHDLMTVLGEQAACPGAAGANFQDPAGTPLS